MSDAVQPLPDFSGLTFEKVWAGFQELKRAQQETDRQIREFAKSVNEFKGDISNRLGEVAEHLVAPHIEEKFNELGFDFPESALNVKVKDSKTHQVKLQIDILLENGSSVVAVEVKTKPTVADVKEFTKRLETFRKCRNERPQGEQRIIYGAMAGAVFQHHVKDAALKAGFFIITQSGDTMQGRCFLKKSEIG